VFFIDRMCSLYPYSTGTLQDLPPPYTPREGVERSGGELEVSRMNFGGHCAKSASPCMDREREKGFLQSRSERIPKV
jgi:hypothetical protein